MGKQLKIKSEESNGRWWIGMNTTVFDPVLSVRGSWDYWAHFWKNNKQHQWKTKQSRKGQKKVYFIRAKNLVPKKTKKKVMIYDTPVIRPKQMCHSPQQHTYCIQLASESVIYYTSQ